MLDRGSALLTAVISVIVLTLIAGVVFALSLNHWKMESSEEKGLKAYYLAEAGIQYGVAVILENEGVPEEPATEDNPFGEEYGGSFTVNWETDEDEEILTITSTGQYEGVARKIEAGFTIPE